MGWYVFFHFRHVQSDWCLSWGFISNWVKKKNPVTLIPPVSPNFKFCSQMVTGGVSILQPYRNHQGGKAWKLISSFSLCCIINHESRSWSRSRSTSLSNLGHRHVGTHFTVLSVIWAVCGLASNLEVRNHGGGGLLCLTSRCFSPYYLDSSPTHWEELTFVYSANKRPEFPTQLGQSGSSISFVLITVSLLLMLLPIKSLLPLGLGCCCLCSQPLWHYLYTYPI